MTDLALPPAAPPPPPTVPAARPGFGSTPRSGRRLTPGVPTPHPLVGLLPALFQEDPFATRLCAALDEVLAPVLVALDCLDAYLDPALAPPDFVDWLAGWVGLALDQNWPESQRRALVARAGELYRWQGTRRGLIQHLRLYTGVDPEVSDSGGAAWSSNPGGSLPGDPDAEVRVRVVLGSDSSVDERAVEAIVMAAKPAHVRHRIEVVRGTPETPPDAGPGGSEPGSLLS